MQAVKISKVLFSKGIFIFLLEMNMLKKVKNARVQCPQTLEVL